jgi:hypothetical protein
MIALHSDLVPCALKVMSPQFHRLYDGQEFAILFVVVLLSWRALSAVEIDLAEDSEAIKVIENAGNRTATRVGL